MASNEKGNSPVALEPQVVKRLLDLLSSDDDFRTLFQEDADAALKQAGYRASQKTGSDLSSIQSGSGGSCMQSGLANGLASKEQIERDRQKLEAELSLPFSFTCPQGFQAE